MSLLRIDSVVKIEGAGNTFLLLDTLAQIKSDKIPPDIIRSLCHLHNVDGFLHIVPDISADCRMHYYNRDGSEGSMCGNGLRCVAFHLGKEVCSIATQVGIRKGFCYPTTTKVEMGIIKPPKRLTLDGYDFFIVDSGVPHVLTYVPDISTIDLTSFGPYYRYHEAFKPHGANISVVQKRDDETLLIRTYERGVEAETGACGTAACAACSVLNPQHTRQYEVIPPSTMSLIVEISPTPQGNIAFLEGPCSYVP